MHTRLRTAIVGLAIAAATLTAGCANTPDTGAEHGKPVANGNLTWVMNGANLDAGHMDPHRSQIDSSAVIGRLTLDSLTYLDSKGKLRPWLARSWKVADNGAAVEFKLRRDVTFTDGEKLTAQAVKENFEHIVDPKTASTHAVNLLGGKLYKDTVVVDPHTVRVEFNKPFAPFLANSSNPHLGIYSPKVLREKREQLATGGPGVNVGSGPWIMTKLKAGTSLSFTRNPDYKWAPKGLRVPKHAAKTLTINLVPDGALRLENVASGDAQLATDLSPGIVDDGDTSGLHVTTRMSPGVPNSLYLNLTEGRILDDKTVRQALQLSAPRAAAVKSVFRGFFTPAKSLLTPTTPYITKGLVDRSEVMDVAKAEKLLDKAGWKRSGKNGIREKDGKKLSLLWVSWTPRSDDAQALADLLIDGWKKAGIEVKNQVVEPATYMKHYTSGDYDLTDWGFGSVDPDILRNHLSSTGFQNAMHLKDPEIDKKLDEAVSTTDRRARTKIYDELQKWNADFVAILPLYNQGSIAVNNHNVDGIVFDGYGWPMLHGASRVK